MLNGPRDSSQRAVLFAIASKRRSNLYTKTCFPSVDSIAKETGLSRATVTRAIAALKKWEWIGATHRKSDKKPGRPTNEYSVDISKFSALRALEETRREDEFSAVTMKPEPKSPTN